jgi:phosphate starvation-inducible PhoH-like protein
LPTARTPAGDGIARSTRGNDRKSSPRDVARKRVVVTFDDNQLLPRLLGEYDSHLALIEQRLGITAHAHGNAIILEGSEETCGIAKSALEALYKRVVAGAELAAGDFDGLLRHANQAGPAANGQGQIATRKKTVNARTPNQSIYINALESFDLVFGVGPAGTGKTYLAVACAAMHLERGNVERIILSRPAVEAGERLGFLPGDMREKVDPYLRPLYDALYDVLPPEKVEKDIEAGIIEVAPLAFMRGRTLTNAFVILDEAQNTTSMQMKMFLTRLGENAKMVVTGDPSQVDLPPGQRSGLEEAINLLDGVRGIEAVRFLAGDVVRRDIVGRIVEAYETAEAASSVKQR